MLLVRRRAYPNRHVVGAAAQTVKIAHGHRDQIRRHLGRRREDHRMLIRSRARCVGRDLAVRDRHIALVDDERDRERRFECRFVEGGERPPRVGRFELRHSVVARLALAQIKTAQLIVQDAAVGDVNLSRAGGDRLWHRQSRRLIVGIQRDGCFLSAGPGADRHVSERDLGGVQHDPVGGGRDVNVDRFAPIEACVSEVDDKFQIVVIGRDRGRQARAERRVRAKEGEKDGCRQRAFDHEAKFRVEVDTS